MSNDDFQAASRRRRQAFTAARRVTTCRMATRCATGQFAPSPPREYLPPEIYHRKNNMKYQMANQNDGHIIRFNSSDHESKTKINVVFNATLLFQ